jgi:ribosomal protein S18 acetylase RimI-like enzyme
MCARITVEPITLHNLFVFRDVRLRALREAPHAFSSTYASECQLTDADWIERAERWKGETGVGFVAMDGSNACGIVGSYLEEDTNLARLVSMWTAPSHRQLGIGRLLVNEVIGWAHQRGACVLLLMVTANNEPAISFYRRLGFTPTGRTEPYPNDPRVIEHEMLRPLP